MTDLAWLNWAVAAGLGALIGAAEIISLHRDEPDDALLTIPSFLYLFINALASAIALGLIQIFKWEFGITEPNLVGIGQAVIAGLGAMAILRASIFNVKVGDEVVPVGPSRLLDTVLNTVKQAVDRKRGEARSATVSKIMQNVDFKKAHMALPAYCFALLQGVPEEEQKKFALKMNALDGTDIRPKIKTLLMGLSLLNLVGEKVLAIAVRDLSEEMQTDPEPENPPVA